MGFNNRKELSELVRSTSIQSEKAYLGCLLGYGTNGELPTIKLVEDDFYDQSLAKLFTSIKELVNDKAPPEMIAVRDKLIEKGVWGKGITNQTLVDLNDGGFLSTNLSRYEYSIKDCRRRREVENLIIMLQDNENKDPAELLKMGNQLIQLATSNGGVTNKGLSHEDIEALYEKIAENNGKKLFGFSFGDNFKFLDEATKGIQKGKTYRIGAPSNVGKSQLMYSVINNLVSQGAKVAFFTLENDKQTTLSFLLSNYMQKQNDKIMNGEIEGDWEYLTQIKDRLTIIEDVFDINSIFSRVMELQPDIVILDYIGLIGCKGFTEEQKFTEYAIQTQRFVKASQVAWIDLSNLPTQLQSAEDIKVNPQFFGSTFLRNNTDVGIHLTPNKRFYELREKIMDNSKNYNYGSLDNPADYYKYMSGVQITLSKNRLGPHSLKRDYAIDYSKGGKWEEMTENFLAKMEMEAL